MNIKEIFESQQLKAKEKIEAISQLILKEEAKIPELIEFARKSKDSVKATCMEALEYVTKNKPEILTSEGFLFAIESLKEKAPAVKREAARVIANTSHLFVTHLDEAVKNLQENANHAGTVVRWSAAYALGQIVKLKTHLNKTLVPKIETIINTEVKISIKKIYQEALKKIKS